MIHTAGRAAPPPRGHFARFLAVYGLIHLLAVGGALLTLWQFLSSYEHKSPGRIAAAAAAQIQSGCYGLLSQSRQMAQNPYQTPQQQAGWFARQLQGKDIAAQPGSQPGCYELTANGQVFARFWLQPQGEKDLFGLQPYTVSQVELVGLVLPQLEILAPQQAQVSVNGIGLQPGQAADTGTVVEGYAGLPDPYAQPLMLCYRLQDLAGTPDVSARLAGQPCQVEYGEGTATVTGTVPQEVQQAVVPLARQASQLYARFITQDAQFDQLSPYLVPGTPFYETVRTFYNGWYIPHDTYAVGDMQIGDFQSYSPDHLSCQVTFLYQVYKGARSYDFPSCYNLYFLMDGGSWKIANLTVG